jgi:hypothetical protein
MWSSCGSWYPLQMLLDEIDARSRIEPPVSHTPNRDQLSPGFKRKVDCHLRIVNADWDQED